MEELDIIIRRFIRMPSYISVSITMGLTFKSVEIAMVRACKEELKPL